MINENFWDKNKLSSSDHSFDYRRSLDRKCAVFGAWEKANVVEAKKANGRMTLNLTGNLRRGQILQALVIFRERRSHWSILKGGEQIKSDGERLLWLYMQPWWKEANMDEELKLFIGFSEVRAPDNLDKGRFGTKSILEWA